MAPTPIKDLREHVDRVQSMYPDPAERLRALEVLKRDLTDILGMIGTYENDARLQVGGDGGNASAGAAPAAGD